MVKKLKGSALQFAILISVLIFIILGAFLLLTYTYSALNNQTANLIKNIYDAEEHIIQYTGKKKNINGIISLQKSYWGSYEKVKSSSGEGITSFSRSALLGSEIAKDMPVLYLEDQNMPLVLAGNAKIHGDVYVPGKFIKPGSVAGEYFRGSNLVSGSLNKSREKLPELENAWLKYVDSLFSITTIQGEIKARDIRNSFLNEEKILVINSEYIDFNIKGNVVIFSLHPVIIKSSASLNQVLVIAPKIKVQGGFKGSFHAMTSNFESGENCHFQYPSSITTLMRGTGSKTKDIIINKGTIFEGNIISLNPENVIKNLGNVLIQKNTQIRGFIYCQGTIEFYGKIQGSLYSEKVITSKRGSKYLNHLYNCTITNENLPNTLAGPLLLSNSKTIASWLY